MPIRHVSDVPAETVTAGLGTERQVLIGDKEAPNFAMRRFVMQPGGGIPPHTNTVEHEQYVLRGRAKIGIGDEVRVVERDTVIFIPAGTPHWYEVEGDEPFEFLCIIPILPDEIRLLGSEDSSARRTPNLKA